MPTDSRPATLDFLATWTDTYGNKYEQKMHLAPGDTSADLSAHFAWVNEHHAIAEYSVKAI